MNIFMYTLFSSFVGTCVYLREHNNNTILCDSAVTYLSVLLLRFSSYTTGTAFIDHTVFSSLAGHGYYYNFRISTYQRVFIIAFADTFVNSIEDLYQTAGWFEREAAEMFNIFYTNSLDTRNLLLAYNMHIGPLCKEVCCTGIGQIHYDIGLNHLYWYVN